jgi:glycosyltransferase involved in cell wall biosynthesis
VKILLWHGYLLSGSGSNVYTANVAASWRRQGHEVLVMCQARDAARFDFVDNEGDFSDTNSSFGLRPTGATAAPGRCDVVRPALGGLLPVYVYDDYEGFVVKRFVDLDGVELQNYVDRNVTAMETALRNFEPDVVITGHEVMGPFIAKVACGNTGHAYIAKLHGSALEYAVKIQDRYLEYAREGLGSAAAVVGGSRYMLEAAAAVIPGWSHKGCVVNPGVDVDLFKPLANKSPATTVAYVGKLITEKGVHHLLAALGATHTEHLRAVIVGYGGDEDLMRSLWSALRAGDAVGATRVAEDLTPNEHLMKWLGSATPLAMARFAAIPLEFTGRLEHGPLSKVLPTFDVLVVPSVVPEAFGMVAAEAAACGVLPLVPTHSGISEAGEAIEDKLGLPGLLRFDHLDPIAGIATGIDRLLAIDPPERLDMGIQAVELATERWSWDRVGDGLLAAAV